MPDNANDVFLHLAPVLAMLGMVIINLTVSERRLQRRNTKEGRQLAHALHAELRTLRELCGDNLDLITQNATGLLSTRSAMAYYKGNLGRLSSLLDSGTIAAIVEAFSFNERLEALLAAGTKPNGGFAYYAEPGKSQTQQLKYEYARGFEKIDAALTALDMLIAASHSASQISRRVSLRATQPAAQFSVPLPHDSPVNEREAA